MPIVAADEKEHDKTFRKVLKHANKHGIKFNYNKTQLNKKEVLNLGVCTSSEGLKPDLVKIEAILKMPDPKKLDMLKLSRSY